MDSNLKKTALSLLLSSALISVYAQNVETIRYEGMVHISEAVAKRLNEVKIGEPLDAIAVDKTVKAFF